MHIRDLAKQKWREAGLYDSRKAKVRAFLKHVDDHPDKCWDEWVQEFRDHYYDLFKDLIPPLLYTDDKLLRLTLIRKADLRKRRELNLLKKFVREADPVKDEPELSVIAKLSHKGLTAELAKRTDLTSKVRRAIQPQPTRPRSAKNIVIPKS